MSGRSSPRRWRVRSIAGALLAAAVFVAACSTSTGSVAPPPTAPPGGAVIVAQDQHFDRSRLDLPAGVTAALVLDNRDASPHNVAILDAAGTSVFAGEIFGGAGTRTTPSRSSPRARTCSAATSIPTCKARSSQAGTLPDPDEIGVRPSPTRLALRLVRRPSTRPSR